MSQSRPANREEFKDFCLRQLGYPVIQINVDDVQVEDAVDNALQYFTEFHFDGTERTYLKHQITEQDKTNQYIQLSSDVIGATRVFPISHGLMGRGNMFDLRYQLRLNDLWDLSSTSYVNYSLTMQHLRTLDLIFSGETPVTFNRLNERLYIQMDWTADVDVGEYVVVEAFVAIDPIAYSKTWNDRLFKELATAYIKRQWGNNVKKYGHMQLPGGVTLNGQQMYEEAEQTIVAIKTEIRNTYEQPPQFLVG